MSEESEWTLWQHIIETKDSLEKEMKNLHMAIGMRDAEKAIVEAHVVLGIATALTELLESLLRRK